MKNQSNPKELPVYGFPGYSVSSDGGVYSYKFGPRKKLSPHCRNGYLTVALSNDLKHPITLLVHRLVAEAFVDNPESNNTVNHKNRKRDDNRAENLEWVTRGENARLGHLTRTEYAIGEDHGRTKFTQADIEEIIRLRGQGITQVKIGAMFGVLDSCISRILSGKRWGHLANRKEAA
jgi:hypothetical protein